MTDKTLRIKLEFDGSKGISGLTEVTTVIGKQTVALTEQAKQTTSLIANEKIKNALITEQTNRFRQLLTTINNLNSAPKLSDSLKLGASLAAITSYNNALRRTEQSLSRIQASASINPNALAQRPATQPYFTNLTAGLSSVGGPHLANIEASRRLVEGLSAVNRQTSIVNATTQANTNVVTRNSAAINTANITHRSLATHILEIIGIYRAYNLILNTVGNSLRAIPRIGIELESTVASLTATTNSSQKAGVVMEFLRQEADRTGIAISALRENFRTFQASTSLAGENLETTVEIFKDINTTITSLHLPTEKAVGIFNALAQIFNKSKVQSEELVKQLGNLIPGAFASFATANREMFKNTQDLINQMKQGAVFAHDTIANFADFLATRFGAAFTLASEGLNANLGRMQTSFILLGEAIYSTTSGPLNSFVKGVTGINNYFIDAIKGVNSFGESVNTAFNILVGLAIASLARFATGLVTFTSTAGAATGAVRLFQASLAFLSSPFALIAGITLLTGKFTELRDRASDAAETINTAYANLTQKTAAITKDAKLVFEVQNDAAVTKAVDALAIVQGRLKSLQNNPITGTINKISKTDEYRELEQQVIKGEAVLNNAVLTATAAFNAKDTQVNFAHAEETERTKLNVELAGLENRKDIRARTRLAELQFERAHYEDIAKLKALANAGDRSNASPEVKTTADQARKDLQILNEAKARSVSAALDKQNTKQVKEAQKELKDLYRDTNREIKNVTEETNANLAVLDIKYEDNIISIKEYYETKRRLQLQAIADEQAAYEQAQRLASKTGDSGKVEEFKDKIDQSKSQAKQILAQSNRQEIVDNRNLLQVLEEINIEYLKLTGNVEQAGLKQFDLQNKAKTDLLKANSNAPGVKEAIERQNLNRQHEQYVSRLLISTEKQKIANDTLTNAELRLNTNRNAGLDTQLDFMLKIEEARKSAVKTLETQLILDEQSAARNKATGAELQDLANRRAALQALKQDAEVTANFMRTTFSEAFSNNFSDFILGAKTAGEAFTAFGQSILKTIADIAAQQLAKSLIGLAFNIITAGAGSGADAFNAKASLGLNPFNGSGAFALNPKALGDVSSNTNLSKLSGTILTKPTIIPFARGGTFALAGEAGHEAIMPLTRDSSGKLGVKAINNTTNSGSNVYQITVNVEKSKDETSSQTGQKVAVEIMRTIARKEIQESQRVGNTATRK